MNDSKKLSVGKNVAWVWVVTAIVIVALVVWGVWWAVSAHSQSRLNDEWDGVAVQASSAYVDSVQAADSLGYLDDVLGESLGGRELVSTASVDETVAGIVQVQEGFLAANPAFEVVDVEAAQVGSDFSLVVLDVGDVAQSGVQSGGLSPAVSLGVMADELGVDISSSGESSQSGGSAQSGDVDAAAGVVFVAAADQEVRVTREDVAALRVWVDDLESTVDTATDEARILITSAYDVLLADSSSLFDEAHGKLVSRIESAEKLLADTEGKVADDKTRTTLSEVIKSAKEISVAKVDDSLVSALDAQAGKDRDASQSLKAAMDEVSASKAAKDEADRLAAEAAVAAERARQQASTSSSGSSGSWGGSSYSGGSSSSGGSSGWSGGGSSSSSSGGSWSGGGSSSGGSSGWDGTIKIPEEDLVFKPCREGVIKTNSMGVTTKCVGGVWVDF